MKSVADISWGSGDYQENYQSIKNNSEYVKNKKNKINNLPRHGFGTGSFLDNQMGVDGFWAVKFYRQAFEFLFLCYNKIALIIKKMGALATYNQYKILKLMLFLAIIFPLSFFVFTQKASAADINAKKWQVVEIPLIASNTYTNPYTEVEVTATFTHTSGTNKIVKGFWDGDRNYKIRFTPTLEGTWSYTVTNNKSDSGLRRIASDNEKVIASGVDTINSKGFLRVDEQYPTKFSFDNGEYYLMLGTTAYEYVTNANANLNNWKNTVDFYKSKGINKVRFFVFPTDYRYYDSYTTRQQALIHGMKYPDTRPFERLAGQPDKTNHDSLNISHWRVLDQMVQYMNERGVVADLIMINDPRYNRSYATTNPSNPALADLRYFRYIISRYAAYPNVIWCLTNEWQLEVVNTNYGIPNKPHDDSWDYYWNHIGNIIRNEDPWMQDGGKNKLLSIHGHDGAYFPDEAGRFSNQVEYYVFHFADQSWPTFSIAEWGTYASFDDWAAQQGVLKPMESNKPSVNDESMYVGWVGWGDEASFNSTANRRYTWATYLAGGYFTIGDSFDKDGKNAYEGTLNDRNWGHIGWSSGDYYYGKDMKKAYDEMKIFSDYFSSIEYWKMTEHNELVPGYASFKRVYTLANPGNEYVIYSAVGNPFTINLVSGSEYDVYQFNPRIGGNEVKIATVPASASSKAITPPSGGEDWVYRIIKNNDGPPPPDPVFEIDPNGTYIEAESFTGDIIQGSATFNLDNTRSGYSGSGYLRSVGDGNTTCPALSGGREYHANFTSTGTYRIWVRGYGADGLSDSIFVGLDGNCLGAIVQGTKNQWIWTNSVINGSNVVNVATAGPHAINIWVRENNNLVDKLYLTKGTETPTDSLPPTNPADVNSDGRVNIKDIQICIKAIVAPDSFTTPEQLNQLAKCKALALPEDIVNIKDIQEIIRKIITP